jgi:hypothetical protein
VPESEAWCGDHGISMRRKQEIIGKLGNGNLASGFSGLRGRWDVGRLDKKGGNQGIGTSD